MKLKLMSMAAMALSALLCLTTTGAWAGQETPLITILSADNADFTSGSKTFDNKVTVTFSGEVENYGDGLGWISGEVTLTVTAAAGYTITGVKFYNSDGGSGFDYEAPFQAILVDEEEEGYFTKVNDTSIGEGGVTKIEVYGYETPATVAVTGVTLSPTTATLTLGETETVTLTATVAPATATDKSVTWLSSNTSVATVSNEGVVTAVAAGEATITVTTTDGAKTATCTVTVAAPEPAQPEWVQDGDTWDDATKTLTVNSNPVSNAYSSMSDIENLVISDAVTSIGVAAFGGCTGLTSMVVASENTTYDSRDCNAIIETSSNTLIAGCKNTIIPNSVTSIGEGAFHGCSSLTSITIPSSVTSIGNIAFANCQGLTSITIPSSVTSIGADAFYNYYGSNITDVYCYPNAANLTWDDGANDDFKADGSTVCHVHADQLSAYQEKFTGEVNVTFVGDLPAPAPAWLLDGDEWDDATKTLTVNSNLPENAYKGQTVIEHVIISSSVTSVGNSAFDGCSGLTSVTIPNSVTSIGYATFAGCTGLTSITIPNSVTSIGNAAFYQCSGLTSITIPNSVTSIGNLAFRYCSGLETVTINAESLESYGTSAFQGTAEGLKI